jgi:hypothetical protein
LANASITASREEALGITIPQTLLVRADGAIYDRLWHDPEVLPRRVDVC